MTSAQIAFARETVAKVAPRAPATGSPWAAGGMADAAGGFERSRDGNGNRLNGIPASGHTVATVALPGGIVLGR